jgi:hypothetical protein
MFEALRDDDMGNGHNGRETKGDEGQCAVPTVGAVVRGKDDLAKGY